MFNSATKKFFDYVLFFRLVSTYLFNANRLQPRHHFLVNENDLDQALKTTQSQLELS